MFHILHSTYIQYRTSEEAAVIEWGHSAIISALDGAVAAFGPQTSQGVSFVHILCSYHFDSVIESVNIYACVCNPPLRIVQNFYFQTLSCWGRKALIWWCWRVYSGSVLNSHAAGCKTLCYIILLFAQCQSLSVTSIVVIREYITWIHVPSFWPVFVYC